jgi:hypothetical protein
VNALASFIYNLLVGTVLRYLIGDPATREQEIADAMDDFLRAGP